MKRDKRRALEAAAAALGATLTIDEGGKHARVTVKVGSRTGLVVVSQTASDHRATLNAIGDIRRMARQLSEAA